MIDTGGNDVRDNLIGGEFVGSSCSATATPSKAT